MTTSNEKYYLVKYKDNYADEFNIYGHIVLDERKLNVLKDAINTTEEFNFYFGTNEDIDYNGSKSIWRTLTIIEITKDDVATLEKIKFLEYGLADEFIDRIVEEYSNRIEDEIELGFADVNKMKEVNYFFGNLE